jgi:hypothetical protein
MRDLHTLVLSHCRTDSFLLVLNPSNVPSKNMLCPKLQEIIFYIESSGQLNIDDLVSMVKEREMGGAKLSAMIIISTGTFAPTREVFRVRRHVSRVKYKFEDEPPEWDVLAD